MKPRSRFFLCAVLTFLTLGYTASAQHSQFLKLSPIDGESTDKGHKDWIDISSFQQSLSSPVSTSGGMAGTAGRVKFDEFLIEKKLDKASPRLMLAAASGQRFPEALIELARNDGRENRVFLIIRLTDVIVSGISYESGETGNPRGTEKLRLSFSSFHWEYKGLDPKAETVKEGWDIKKNARVQ